MLLILDLSILDINYYLCFLVHEYLALIFPTQVHTHTFPLLYPHNRFTSQFVVKSKTGAELNIVHCNAK